MVKVISFCLYGTGLKYRVGLQKNLQLIPDGYEMWVYVGSDVEPEYALEGARIIRCDSTGQRLMFERFNCIRDPTVDICFFRDADSRILERDRWCMKEFEASSKTVHIIRDHFWHKSRIMGGTWGAKRGALSSIDWESWMSTRSYAYGQDEAFLAACVYPNCNPLIHSSIVGYPGEDIQLIGVPESDDFVGQVYDENDVKQFGYNTYPYVKHLQWLAAHDQWAILAHIADHETLSKLSTTELTEALYPLFQAYFYLGKYDLCQKMLEWYRYGTVSEHVLQQTSYLVPALGKKVVGTTNASRLPHEDEIVILYGNFMHTVDALPATSLVLRHAQYVDLIHHHSFEFHPAWNRVERIYIMNLETRRDRYIETMAELARMHAPLHRVFHYKGKTSASPLIGATQNHVDCLRNFVESGKDTALFLEDDFTFTSRTDVHLKDLQTFMDRKYDYDVCLLSTSRFYKRTPHDDLLDRSYQECTTSAGYLVSRESAKEVLRVVEEGLRLIEGGDTQGVIDRYWAILQKRNKFFCFREKMGYQRCGYSNIKNTVTAYFD